MRKTLFLLLGNSLIWLAACKDISSSTRPALSQKEMVPVVYGLMMVDEYGNHLKIRDSSLGMDSFRQEKYNQVFRMNKTDVKTFNESYQYYLGRPGELKVIFDSVESYSTKARIEVMSPAKKNQTKKLEERKKQMKSQ